MAEVLTIGGVNRTANLHGDSLKIEQVAGEFSAVCSFKLNDETSTLAIQTRDAGHYAIGVMRLSGQDLSPVQTRNVLYGLHCKCLRRSRKLSDQHDIQTRFRYPIHDRGQIIDCNHLSTQVDNTQHMRVCAGYRRDIRHGNNFTDLEHIDAKQFRTTTDGVFAQLKKQ